MKSPLLLLVVLAGFAHAWGEDITVTPQTFTGTQTVGTATTGNILTQGTVTIASGANVTFVANNAITLKPGFTASGLFLAYLNVPTTVTIAATDSSAGEPGTNTGTLTLTRVGTTAIPLTVYFSVSGSATVGTDYGSLGTSVVIPAGISSQTITLTPVNDSVVESSETVVLTLAAGTGYTVGAASSATVTIADDDQSVSITATDSTASEPGSDNGTLTVTRTGATAAALTVNLSVSGTATSGSDFTALATSVTFAAGITTKTITVTPINNTTAEPNETVIVTLVAGAAYSLAAANSATVTIIDDEQTVTIAATDDVATEPGTDTGTYTLTRTGVTTAALTVNVTVSGTATSGTDFTALGTSVIIPSGAAIKTITLTVLNDAVAETSETVIVTLAAASGYTVGTPNAATVTISDLLTVVASAEPTAVVGKTTTLSAITYGADDPNKIYTWQAVGYVPGVISYSVNGTHAAKQTVVTFTKAGKYIFRVSDGSPVTSASTNGLNYVMVTVHQERNRIVVSPSSVTMVGTQSFTATVFDQFSNPMELKGQAYNWSASGGNLISSDGVFSGYVVGSSTVTCSAGALSGSASVTVADHTKVTQVWIEKLADPFDEPTAVATTNHKQVFRLFVRNPPHVQWVSDGKGGGISVASSGTRILLSGTTVTNAFSVIEYYNTYHDYWSYYWYPDHSGAFFPQSSPMFFPGTGSIPSSGTWGNWVIDDGNNLTLAFIDVFVSTRQSPDAGIEGKESIIATIMPVNPALSGFTELTPSGKPNSATAWIKEPGYTNSAPTVTTPASATPSTAVANDANLGIIALSQSITMSSTLSVVANDNLGESTLTYVWEAIGASPAPVIFSGISGTNAHKTTTAQFSRAGDYTLRVTITDREGLKVTSQVNVKVKPAATPMLKITPEITAVVPGQTYQFTAVPIDQFGNPIDQWLGGWRPTRWEVNGGGTIDQDGIFTAGSSVGGPFTITAYSQPYKNVNLYASAGAGWSSSGRALVTIAPPPIVTIAITSPAANAVITSVPFNATVSVQGDNVVDEVRLDGFLLGLKPTTPFTKSLLLSPPDGPFTITATAETIYGSLFTTSRTVMIAARPLAIVILSPPDNKVFNQPMVYVTARRPTLTTTVTIQGRPATASGYEASVWVSLAAGNNIITAIGKDGTRTGQDSVPLTFTAPPGYNPNGDSDGDGVPNNIDLFPYDPTDSADRDNDGIGDNADKNPDDPNASKALIITKPTKSDTFRANY